MIPEIPVVRVPEAWLDALGQWQVPDAETMAAAYFDPSDPVHALAADRHATGVAAFADQLHEALEGPSRSAVVSCPAGASTIVAAMLVGEVLGGVRTSAKPPLVGPIEVDAVSGGARSTAAEEIEFRTGMRPDYDQFAPWHTDCGPWHETCRWTVLGATYCHATYADLPTDIEPLWRVLATWSEDPAHLEVLRATAVDWRQIFEGIGALRATVLEADRVRWLAMLLPRELEDQHSPIGRACAAFERHLATVDRPCRAYLAEGLLVIDNQRVLHRGPQVAQPGLRRILKVKIGGLPEA
jgi:hypothetical protein